jgi:hypothetical protein
MHELTNVNFMNIPPAEGEFFHADRRSDGRTDRQDEANSSFQQFSEQAENGSVSNTFSPVQ